VILKSETRRYYLLIPGLNHFSGYFLVNLFCDKSIMKIYRAISEKERDDYYFCHYFRTSKNTLEAKQFFKSEADTLDFINKSRKKQYLPPYKYLLYIEIDEDCFYKIHPEEQILDGFEAITIYKFHLPAFNICIKLVSEHVILSDI
jgi:hypothetical protein